jgi:hypothetical protein
VTKIAEFYRDDDFDVYFTRQLVVDACRAVYYSEQAAMLNKRKVPATLLSLTSMAQLKAIVGGGKRPVILAMLMGRVPYSVRGHSYTGWHAVVCMDTVVVNGVRGFLVMDPNFSPAGGIRPDPQHGKRFYSEGVIQSAFFGNYQHFAIVPNHPKGGTVGYVTFNKGVYVSLRTSPDARQNNAYAVADWSKNEIRRVSDGKWIGRVTARRTLYAVVSGYDSQGRRQSYNKLRLAGTGRYEYVDSRFMHRV